jgi:hypothetical protein
MAPEPLPAPSGKNAPIPEQRADKPEAGKLFLFSIRGNLNNEKG